MSVKPIRLRCAMCDAEMDAPITEYETTKGTAINFPVIQCVNGHGPMEMEVVGGLLGTFTSEGT